VKAYATITEWTQQVTNVGAETIAEGVNGCFAFKVRE
jgi:hypothetical protein